MAQCDVNLLLADAACFTCLSPGILEMLEVQLLCNIAGTSLPSANQEVFPGHYGGAIAPTFVPPLNRGVAPDLDPPFVLWAWNPDTQTWT